MHKTVNNAVFQAATISATMGGGAWVAPVFGSYIVASCSILIS